LFVQGFAGGGYLFGAIAMLEHVNNCVQLGGFPPNTKIGIGYGWSQIAPYTREYPQGCLSVIIGSNQTTTANLHGYAA
jgi:hypothetical protein